MNRPVRMVTDVKTMTTLSSFKASVDAYEIAAFDGWHGRAHLPVDTTSPMQLWDEIEKLSCFEPDWNSFKSRLSRDGESEVACRCGGHFVSAFLIRRRWSLLVLGRHSLVTPAVELLPVRTRTMETLGRILSELDDGETTERPPGNPRGGDGGASPAELGIPLWWARGRN